MIHFGEFVLVAIVAIVAVALTVGFLVFLERSGWRRFP